MGRKATVTPQAMLDAGLAIILRQGYQDVNITTVARELGCSTQPIVWAFGSIEGYRAALRRHATGYMQQKLRGSAPEDALAKAGYAYIQMAIEEPNLIRYLRADERDLRQSGGIAQIFDPEAQARRRDYWAAALEVSPVEAERFVSFTMLHTEGIVSMLLSGVLPPDKDAAFRYLEEGATAYAVYLKTKKG